MRGATLGLGMRTALALAVVGTLGALGALWGTSAGALSLTGPGTLTLLVPVVVFVAVCSYLAARG